MCISVRESVARGGEHVHVACVRENERIENVNETTMRDVVVEDEPSTSRRHLVSPHILPTIKSHNPISSRLYSIVKH